MSHEEVHSMHIDFVRMNTGVAQSDINERKGNRLPRAAGYQWLAPV
jgi:hypothetical protein